MSDQHQTPQTEIQQDDSSLKKKKKMYSLLSLCVFICYGKNDLLSDSTQSDKICFQALGPFLN